ncbi:zinc ABC transporter solute-binding protein [Pseudohalocynthiibacter aestuariivivens]|nr:zinc ABC transporter substrate-binding protein [Pseudohalocynthiibacter aestuariivivens]QIE46231.1 zinc ABC transporter solute-binding protein [Pseudohalocynthiibacter aestuariivivens]
MIKSLLAVTSLLAMSLPAHADTPRVATDILPVQSLVAMVMEGVGTPDLIVQPGASPHGYALRPSDARALQEADLVFWMGPALTPWMLDAINTLGEDAQVTSLLDVDATELFHFREGASLEMEDAHADHDDHEDHEEEHGDHADDDGHDDHDHSGVDPHAWLDPHNAIAWIDLIAFRLVQNDPKNAAIYVQNAKTAQAMIETVSAEVAAELSPLRGRPYIVFHDAYQYFERHFAIPAAGSISLSDASKPSPARLAEIRHIITETGALCVFSEAQFNPGLVATVMEGTDARTALLDPIGAEQTPGADLYPALLRAMAARMMECL